jgi:hopene-associated glycosyltransferase HpnB
MRVPKLHPVQAILAVSVVAAQHAAPEYSVPSAALVVASISLAIWLYLAAARGQFWRLREFDDDTAKHEPPSTWPKVIAVIPARNEAATIAQAVTSLLQQDYAGEFSVVLVDDHSEDNTAQIASQAAIKLNAVSRITIVEAPPLTQGWTGKLWAMNHGVSNVQCRGAALSRAEPREPLRPSLATNEHSQPTYYWFTDADIVHAPNTLQRLVARAEHDHLDLASLMVLLQANTLPERALIPAFLFFFLKLYPPRWIANPQARTAGAAGGCILLRGQALQRIGGFAAIRSEVIDDCALARAVKEAQPFPAVPPNKHGANSTGRIWMGLTRASISLRAYTTFAEIRDLIARTAFTQLQYSAPLLLGTLLAMLLIYVIPVVLLFAPNPAPRILGASTWLLMSLLYLPTIRFYRVSPAWAVTLPFVALFYSHATFLSAARFWLGRGAQWKGRSQASPTD